MHIIGSQPFIARKPPDSGILIDNYLIKNNGDEIEFNFSITINSGNIKLNSLAEFSKTGNLKQKQSQKGGGVRTRTAEIPTPPPPPKA